MSQIKQAITPTELIAAGRALYGPEWQSPLARDLPLNVRSLRYMTKGERGIEGWVARRLHELLQERASELPETVKAVTTISKRIAKVVSTLPPDSVSAVA